VTLVILPRKPPGRQTNSMTPTQYDSSILQQFADDLYSRARWIIFSTAAMYGTVVFVLSITGVLAANHSSWGVQEWGVIGTLTLVAIAIGVNRGREKAFQLKLQAQQILCQRQIEENTRGAVSSKALAARV
jgi:hypothetical protein